MLGEIIVLNEEGTQLEGPREHNKSSMVSEFKHVVDRPYDAEENKLQGTRRIRAFTVVKDIDKLTPQLYKVACLGQNCKEVKIILYRTAKDTGNEEEYFHYILKDAKIISVENYMMSTKDPKTEMLGHQEKVQILAKEFTWKYLEGGVEHTEINI